MHAGVVSLLGLLMALGLAASPCAALADGELKPDLGELKELGQLGKFGARSLELPKLESESLAEVKLQAQPEAPAEASAPTKVSFKIHKVLLGYRFRISRAKGCLGKSPITAIHLEHFPGKADPFVSCLMLEASEGVVASVKARLLAPGGKEVASASGTVAFARPGEPRGFIIEWSGFLARLPGAYALEIELGGSAHKTIQVEVK